MIESTCLEFYTVALEHDRAAVERLMLERQNEGYEIVSVFAWNMGQIGVVYNRKYPQQTVTIGDENNLTQYIDPSVYHSESQSTLKVAEQKSRRTRKPRKQA